MEWKEAKSNSIFLAQRRNIIESEMTDKIGY